MVKRIELPDKLYFKIGEVARIADVKQHVLRFWESEFSSIRPQKSRTNQRLYRRADVEAILAIKHLLYDRKFTIEGARQHLKEGGVAESLPPQDPEKVAAVAREEAMEQIGSEVEKARVGVRERYERELLRLKSMAEQFLGEIDSLERD